MVNVMINCVRYCVVLSCVVFLHSVKAEPTVFHYRASESKNDVRYEYDLAVLTLALEKTKDEYGGYSLVSTPSVTFPRAVEFARKGIYTNFFLKHSFEGKFGNELVYVPFPVDLGIVGYRVCFTSAAGQEKLKNVESLEQLKALAHIQGSGWSDVEILRYNGFVVQEISGYENMFRMIAAGRSDLFCRGANEIFDEYQARKSISNLKYDSTMAIVYPLPRFFYTNAQNTEAAERVFQGLVLAYDDGSLVSLWESYYSENYSFSNLDNRRLFRIYNPLLEGLDTEYQKYFYGPLKKLK